MKGKKQMVSENKLAFTETKISEIFQEVRKKVILDQHQSDLKKQHSVILSSYAEKGRVAEQSTQYSIEAEEYSEILVAMTEQMEEDEEIFKKLKIPWMPEEMHPVLEGKCIDSKNENLQRSIKQYKYQIEYLHETNEGLVTANRRLREYIEEVNSHYQELIVVSKEALKRKRQTQSLYAELKQTIQDLTQQNQDLSKRVEDLEVDHQKPRKKTQALEGITLLAEATKDL